MKPLEFKIVYMADGQKRYETITANSHREAVEICKIKGEFVSCTYNPTATDLIYLH